MNTPTEQNGGNIVSLERMTRLQFHRLTAEYTNNVFSVIVMWDGLPTRYYGDMWNVHDYKAPPTFDEILDLEIASVAKLVLSNWKRVSWWKDPTGEEFKWYANERNLSDTISYFEEKMRCRLSSNERKELIRRICIEVTELHIKMNKHKTWSTIHTPRQFETKLHGII